MEPTCPLNGVISASTALLLATEIESMTVTVAPVAIYIGEAVVTMTTIVATGALAEIFTVGVAAVTTVAVGTCIDAAVVEYMIIAAVEICIEGAAAVITVITGVLVKTYIGVVVMMSTVEAAAIGMITTEIEIGGVHLCTGKKAHLLAITEVVDATMLDDTMIGTDA